MWQAALDQEGVDGAPGFQNGYAEVEAGVGYLVYFEPGEGVHGLIVASGFVTFWNVVEGLLGSGVSVEARVKRVVGEGGFGGNHKTRVEFLQIWALSEQVEYL